MDSSEVEDYGVIVRMNLCWSGCYPIPKSTTVLYRWMTRAASSNSGGGLSMAQWKKEEIKELVEERIKVEVERKKTYGEKISMADIANVTADFIISLMADARRREVGRMLKWKEGRTETQLKWLYMENHLVERRREMTVMAKILWDFAERKEKERPRKGYR